MTVPGDSTPSASSIEPAPAEPEPPERLSVTILDEAGDWSAFATREGAIRAAAAALAAHPRCEEAQGAEACVVLGDDALLKSLNRTYRGKDLEWWMDAAGVLDERYDEVDDIARARRVPSLQLAGTPDRATLDLNALTDLGVRLVGRIGAPAVLGAGMVAMCAGVATFTRISPDGSYAADVLPGLLLLSKPGRAVVPVIDLLLEPVMHLRPRFLDPAEAA